MCRLFYRSALHTVELDLKLIDIRQTGLAQNRLLYVVFFVLRSILNFKNKRRLNKKYNIIYADPAWSYNDKSCNGNALDHYKTMTLKQICDLPIGELADDNCVLFIWGTYPLLPEVLQVIKAWGFTYKSIAFQWVKLNRKSRTPFYGLGRWTRGNTEPCFIAVKGKPQRVSKGVFQLIQEPIGVHSSKPGIVRKKIVELMGDLPRLELFARGNKSKDLFDYNKFDGWDVWGNEVEGSVEINNVQPPNDMQCGVGKNNI